MSHLLNTSQLPFKPSVIADSHKEIIQIVWINSTKLYKHIYLLLFFTLKGVVTLLADNIKS